MQAQQIALDFPHCREGTVPFPLMKISATMLSSILRQLPLRLHILLQQSICSTITLMRFLRESSVMQAAPADASKIRDKERNMNNYSSKKHLFFLDGHLDR